MLQPSVTALSYWKSANIVVLDIKVVSGCEDKPQSPYLAFSSMPNTTIQLWETQYLTHTLAFHHD